MGDLADKLSKKCGHGNHADFGGRGIYCPQDTPELWSEARDTMGRLRNLLYREVGLPIDRPGDENKQYVEGRFVLEDPPVSRARIVYGLEVEASYQRSKSGKGQEYSVTVQYTRLSGRRSGDPLAFDVGFPVCAYYVGFHGPAIEASVYETDITPHDFDPLDPSSSNEERRKLEDIVDTQARRLTRYDLDTLNALIDQIDRPGKR